MKKVYITWHYTTHGIAYLKHVLSAFYQKGLPEKNIHFENLEQIELMDVFDSPKNDYNKFKFDEVIYLITPQSTFDELVSRRFFYKKSILEDNLIQEHGLNPIFEDLISQANKDLCYDLEKENKYVKEKYPDLFSKFKQYLWRNIHHYSIDNQIRWLLDESNFTSVYSRDTFREVKLNIKSLRDEEEIYKELFEWIKKHLDFSGNTEYIINITLGSSETQTVWYLLSELDKLPPKHRFIKTYDNKKAERTERFKPFDIVECPTKIIQEVKKFSLFKNPSSEKRELVNKLFDAFFRSGFSILIIGERGLGKSQLIKELAEKTENNKKTLIQASAASFADDIMAESELFGYEKGTFTGAQKDGKKGLLLEADGGVFFLDEVHHLSKSVQAKLLKALQTDENNKMRIRRLGATKEEIVECKLIFASNNSIEELKQLLLPDFFDRITQHILRIPALREIPEDREKDWESVWKQMKFSEKYVCPKEKYLLEWLKTLELPGNYRDLQKIAIYYKTFLDFDNETKEMLKPKTAFEYAKQQYEKYHSSNTGGHPFFVYGQKAQEILEEFHYQLQEWAIKIYKTRKEAAQALGVDEKTLNNWKNRK